MWPIWSDPGCFDANSSDWELPPRAFAHLDDFSPLPHGQTLVGANSTSSLGAVDAPEALVPRPRAQILNAWPLLR
jgi:hypothetical protein